MRKTSESGHWRTMEALCVSAGLRPELNFCRVVGREIGHFGDNAVVQLENQHVRGVERLALPRAGDSFQNEYVISGRRHCLGLDAQRALALMSELTEVLQDALSASVVSRQYAGSVWFQFAFVEKSVLSVSISPFEKAS
jgi:hypothetical protein